jgi:hypothetical protein
MDNLLLPYLRPTNESEAHRFDEPVLVGGLSKFFLNAGIFVQFSRLKSNRGTSAYRSYALGSQRSCMVAI